MLEEITTTIEITLENKADGKADTKPDNPGNKVADNGLDEWKAARDILSKFDDRIADLRKWGFSFLSGLITADALTKLFGGSGFPNDRIGIAIFSITLVLIIALMVLDKNYQLFQTATSIRARILETRLNLELTETIGFRSRLDNFNDYVLIVYAVFGSVAGAIGVLYFYPRVILTLVTIVTTIVAVIIICLVGTRTPDLSRQVDWSFDRTACEEGENIMIIATNLCDNPVTFPAGTVIEIREQRQNSDFKYPVNLSRNLIIGGLNNYSWEIPTSSLHGPGMYRVFPAYVKEGVESGLWPDPLKRAITVQPKS